MAKRFIDLLLSAFDLLIASPVLLPVMFLVWREDRHSPLYIAPRVGRNGSEFSMVKIRSMVIDVDRKGSSSTSLLRDLGTDAALVEFRLKQAEICFFRA